MDIKKSNYTGNNNKNNVTWDNFKCEILNWKLPELKLK